MPDATITPALRAMLIEFRRARITEANAIAALLALDVVRTEAEWRRRQTETPGQRLVNGILERIGEDPIARGEG